jgi:hypothetical protein
MSLSLNKEIFLPGVNHAFANDFFNSCFSMPPKKHPIAMYYRMPGMMPTILYANRFSVEPQIWWPHDHDWFLHFENAIDFSRLNNYSTSHQVAQPFFYSQEKTNFMVFVILLIDKLEQSDKHEFDIIASSFLHILLVKGLKIFPPELVIRLVRNFIRPSISNYSDADVKKLISNFCLNYVQKPDGTVDRAWSLHIAEQILDAKIELPKATNCIKLNALLWACRERRLPFLTIYGATPFRMTGLRKISNVHELVDANVYVFADNECWDSGCRMERAVDYCLGKKTRQEQCALFEKLTTDLFARKICPLFASCQDALTLIELCQYPPSQPLRKIQMYVDKSLDPAPSPLLSTRNIQLLIFYLHFYVTNFQSPDSYFSRSQQSDLCNDDWLSLFKNICIYAKSELVKFEKAHQLDAPIDAGILSPNKCEIIYCDRRHKNLSANFLHSFSTQDTRSSFANVFFCHSTNHKEEEEDFLESILTPPPPQDDTDMLAPFYQDAFIS